MWVCVCIQSPSLFKGNITIDFMALILKLFYPTQSRQVYIYVSFLRIYLCMYFILLNSKCDFVFIREEISSNGREINLLKNKCIQ